jgi:6-phosphogluconolactonase
MVADLGLDRVIVYRFDAAAGSLSPHTPSGWTMEPGSGPRHLAWHPTGNWLYVIEELANRVTTFAWDSASGRLHALQTVPTLPKGFSGENTSAEILVHGSGQFLYASNRGHDSVAAFAVDPALGTLTLIRHTSSSGKTPRYMAFDRTQQWLLVVNVDSDAVAVLGVDANTGALTLQGTPTTVSRPYGIALTRLGS